MMKKIILRVNYILFWWYYRRVDKHFHSWTFFKSVRLLISNYEHQELLIRNANSVNRTAIKEIDALRQENSNLKIQQIATDGQITDTAI